MEQAEILRNQLLGETLVKKLSQRGFGAYYCADKNAALAKALELIPAEDVVSWGGSVTIKEIGLLDAVKRRNPVIDRDTAANAEEKTELMRRALLCDTYLMSANAISKDGQLVNIDGNGNRVAALIYGPKQVLVIAGMNKVAGTLEGALDRARNVAAPINAARFAGLPTPCAKTGACAECASAQSICSQVVITRTCRVPQRIKVILVGESLGF
ncbi:MAG: lactate utilization protein [Phascolarctobacterium sp.]|uniref:lactate utilization protein n=1 Tax=Phascolarctobacterium sp. TaxID=2049039 RepID=UPI0026DC9B0E|nr:lactate utilization protein [Phascolarctobacterium sp.]MDO4921297.1 lactate utilization protein [Phascolarctobacterium sp.]